MAGVLRQVGRLFETGTVAGFSERQLLERFVAQRDEAAFEAIVARHGPMVLAVCRRLASGDLHAADDAFQATFLVLVLKARALRDPDRLGPWLYGVAHRVAGRMRAKTLRRRARERGDDTVIAFQPAREEAASRDLAPEVHEELNRLPSPLRDVVVLCDLEGHTHEEAAGLLRCPLGTVKGRIRRARELLADRLRRRGLAPTTGAALAGALAGEVRAAVVAPALLDSTVQAAMGLAAGGAVTTAGLVSASAVATAQAVVKTMFWNPLKIGVLALAAAGVVTSSAVVARQNGPQESGRNRAAAAAPDGDVKGSLEVELAKRKLIDARLNLLREEFAEKRSIQASIEIVRGERTLLGKAFDRVAALTAHRDRIKETIKSLKEAGGGAPPTMVAQLEVALAEAELWLAEAKADRPTTGLDSRLAARTKRQGPGLVGPSGDPATNAILAALDQPLAMPFARETTLEDIIKYIKASTQSPDLEDGIPIYLDLPKPRQEDLLKGVVTMSLKNVPLKTTLRLMLKQLDLAYLVKDGLVQIGLYASEDFQQQASQAMPGYGAAPAPGPRGLQ
jgi:RNA polymerase sigma factor (sigma-70 family)